MAAPFKTMGLSPPLVAATHDREVFEITSVAQGNDRSIGCWLKSPNTLQSS